MELFRRCALSIVIRTKIIFWSIFRSFNKRIDFSIVYGLFTKASNLSSHFTVHHWKQIQKKRGLTYITIASLFLCYLGKIQQSPYYWHSQYSGIDANTASFQGMPLPSAIRRFRNKGHPSSLAVLHWKKHSYQSWDWYDVSHSFPKLYLYHFLSKILLCHVTQQSSAPLEHMNFTNVWSSFLLL